MNKIEHRIKKLSIIVSVYNEELVIKQFFDTIYPVLEKIDSDYEILFVNDGSTDATPAILESIAYGCEKVKVINFSRNYGHEAAMIAGIDYSTGDGIICMDADLQHPVECIPVVLEHFNQGYDVITMVRTQNKNAGAIKNIASNLFYKILNKVSEVKFEANASDFFAITRQPAEILKKYFRESSRYLRAYVQNVGFKKTTIEYVANDRAAGESKYSLRKLFKFSIQAMVSYSDLPLKVASAFGVLGALFCIFMIIYTIYTKIVYGTPAGYATIVTVICIMFTILFFLLGIIGEYLSVLLAETRKRPIYIVEEVIEYKKE